MILFAGFLANNGKKAATIRSYMSAIKAVLQDNDVIVNEDRFLLNAITRGCRLNNDKVLIRLPIQKGLLRILVGKLPKLFDKQPYLEALYTALLVTSYFGMFRVGELTKGDHPVRACDVHVGFNKDKVMFILRTSKTHWRDSKPQVIKLSSKDYDNKTNKMKQGICPYHTLREYLKFRKPSYRTMDEPFFVFKDRTPVEPIHFRKVLKEVICQSGLNSSLYNTHSLRAGRSLDLLSMKIPVDLIRKLGRWKSGTVYKYLTYA